jgi:hypothetical protein
MAGKFNAIYTSQIIAPGLAPAECQFISNLDDDAGTTRGARNCSHPEFRSGQPRWDQARFTRADLDSRRTFALTRVR